MSTLRSAAHSVGATFLVVAMKLAGAQQPVKGDPAPHPSVPSQFAFLYAPFESRSKALEAAERAFPYKSIQLARRGCFGTCPIYSATIRADGAATYTGEYHAERIGVYSGRVYFGDVARLAMFIEQSGFMKLADRYAAPWTDDETVIVTVVMRDGTVKSVSNYGRYGPPDLWMLEMAIDGVLARIKWTATGQGRGAGKP